MKAANKQGGFTLLENAIVLVIGVLLLGGLMMGLKLIENSKINSIASDMKAVQSAYHAYIDSHKAIPGDESNDSMNARGWSASAAAGGGNADRVLTIAVAQTFSNGGEQRPFWRALRASGLLAGKAVGAPGAAGLPQHAGGGLMGISADLLGTFAQGGVSVCVSGLTAKQAAGIDLLIDGPDSDNATGTARAAAGTVNPLAPSNALATAAVYAEASGITWTLCMQL